MSEIPGSWVVIRKSDGEAVWEVFSPKMVAAIRRDRYDVMTAADYLGSLNRAIAWPNRE